MLKDGLVLTTRHRENTTLTGLGTVNTTERCVGLAESPLVPIGSTQCEQNVESYGMPLLSKKRFVCLRISLYLVVGFEVAGVCLL